MPKHTSHKRPIFKKGDKVRLTDEGIKSLSGFLTSISDLRAAGGTLTVQSAEYIKIDDRPDYRVIYLEEFPDCILGSDDIKYA